MFHELRVRFELRDRRQSRLCRLKLLLKVSLHLPVHALVDTRRLFGAVLLEQLLSRRCAIWIYLFRQSMGQKLIVEDDLILGRLPAQGL